MYRLCTSRMPSKSWHCIKDACKSKQKNNIKIKYFLTYIMEHQNIIPTIKFTTFFIHIWCKDFKNMKSRRNIMSWWIFKGRPNWGKKCCQLGCIGCPILVLAQKAIVRYQFQMLEILFLVFYDIINLPCINVVNHLWSTCLSVWIVELLS